MSDGKESMLQGIINVYKEKGYTSHDVVAKMRGIFKTRKAGHTGTLDPDAEGVLPVCFGKATKLCEFMEDWKKTYRTVMLLGRTTDTQDAGGKTLEENKVAVSEEEVRFAVQSYKGDYSQVPPMYSALKVNGKKLVDLARRGIEVERKPRTVKIFDIRIESVDLPRVEMTVQCSRGTYIRTLCHDIGKDLKCGACMESLVRTEVGMFSVRDARKLSELEEIAKAGMTESVLVPVDACLSEYPSAVAKPESARFLYNGNRLDKTMISFSGPAENAEGIFRIYDSRGMFIGLYGKDPDGMYRPVRMFIEGEQD